MNTTYYLWIVGDLGSPLDEHWPFSDWFDVIEYFMLNFNINLEDANAVQAVRDAGMEIFVTTVTVDESETTPFGEFEYV